MEKTQQIAIQQMRATVEILGSSTEGEAESNLMRFLSSRSMDVGKAAKMFVKWKKWRGEIAPLGYILDDEVPDELNARKIFLQGASRGGQGTVIILGRNHFPQKDSLQFTKFVAQMMDKALASCIGLIEEGKEKVVGVLDLQHLCMANLDVQATITAFQILQDYYPERLGKVFVLNMPLIFLGAWKIISRFLHKATLEKVEIVTNEKTKLAMVREIGEDVLPIEYGGNANLMLLQDVKLKNLAASS